MGVEKELVSNYFIQLGDKFSEMLTPNFTKGRDPNGVRIHVTKAGNGLYQGEIIICCIVHI